MLFGRDLPKENLVVRGARTLDPGRGVDAVLDVRIDNGVIAELGTSLAPNGHRVVEGGGLVLAPAFVDPHVHLRTPGREDEETIASGTQAAAAGGYCAILAMPNTEPVVDSAAVLGALVEAARAEAEIPVGFLAAITKQQAGVAATAEVTPHHLCRTDDALRSLDPNLKMNPPLRSAEDRAALIAGLQDGVIGAIATDHAPHARDEKDQPFEAAPFGVTGLETSFSALYTNLVEPGLVPLETILERMSAGPARVYGLDEPRIAVGAPANLVLLDLKASWRVTEDLFRSCSVNSWLLGEPLKGRVRATVAAGRVVFAA